MSDIEQRIRERAYQLWQQAGCPDDRGEAFWHAARQEIEAGADATGTHPGESGTDAIDFPRDERSVEDLPEVALSTGLPGEPPPATPEHGVIGHGATEADAKPDARPAEPLAAEASVPASRPSVADAASRGRAPAAETVTRKAADAGEAAQPGAAGVPPGKPASVRPAQTRR